MIRTLTGRRNAARSTCLTLCLVLLATLAGCERKQPGPGPKPISGPSAPAPAPAAAGTSGTAGASGAQGTPR